MSKWIRVVPLSVLLVGPAIPAAGDQHEGESHGHLMVMPDQLEWTDVASMPPGAKIAVLEGDLTKEGPFTMRVQFPADYTIPRHTHPTVERVTVLEGTLYFAIGESFDREKAQALPPGTLAVMEAGVPMYGFTQDEPVVIQVNGNGPWGMEYVDPAEDPRHKMH